MGLSRATRIVDSTRKDFEDGTINSAVILDIAYMHYPSARNPWRKAVEAYEKFGFEFPMLSCGFASLVLKHRLTFDPPKPLRALNPEIVEGTYDNQPHSFVCLGSTAISELTIADEEPHSQ